LALDGAELEAVLRLLAYLPRTSEGRCCGTSESDS
jgi:hypothetical protein